MSTFPTRAAFVVALATALGSRLQRAAAANRHACRHCRGGGRH